MMLAHLMIALALAMRRVVVVQMMIIVVGLRKGGLCRLVYVHNS